MLGLASEIASVHTICSVLEKWSIVFIALFALRMKKLVEKNWRFVLDASVI